MVIAREYNQHLKYSSHQINLQLRSQYTKTKKLTVGIRDIKGDGGRINFL